MELGPKPVIPIVQPEYASPVDPSVSRRGLRFAAFCGALPMTLGCAIFLLWLYFRSELLEVAGFLNILFGLICVASGGIGLLICFLAMAPGSRRLCRFFKESWIAIILLLVNFPTALLIIRAVDYVDSRYPVSTTRGNVD